MNGVLYYPAGIYKLSSDIIITKDHNPVVIKGDGAHASILEFTDTSLGIKIDQRDGETLSNFGNWQVDISDICIRYADTKHGPPGSSAVRLWGRGTNNTIDGLLSIRRVQFGRPGKNNPGTIAYPGTWEYYPEMWIDASGVFGLEIQRCNFRGQIQGSLSRATSYYPQAGVRFTNNAGEFTEINGNRYPVRSMGNWIEKCHFGPMRIGVECEEEHHIEGTRVNWNDFVGPWGAVHIRGNKHHNTQFIFQGNHGAFRRKMLDVEAGAHVTIANNSMIAHATGYFESSLGEPYPHFIRLGEAKEDHGVVLATVKGNTFGRSPTPAPPNGIVIDGASSHIYIEDNLFQGAMQRVNILGSDVHTVRWDGVWM